MMNVHTRTVNEDSRAPARHNARVGHHMLHDWHVPFRFGAVEKHFGLADKVFITLRCDVR